ncbi:Ig-like domain-containing protein [Caballeronia sordidicola]|uniref:Large repetitive protein n=1 Tax=Caballeronia sordidicola TaxID=196367 RepID=A0A226WM15_CABSO|nr:Ig-like domain-containing protein [Caballeronia sordidicola]OXC71817.1 Large repetitive protein [Caballeronia sordidicola]
MSTILKASQTPIRSVVDTVVPSTPTIFSVLDPNVGSLDPNGTSTSARPLLGGGGVAGDVVTVFDNGVAIGSAVVGSNGSWHLTPTADMSNGFHALTATDTNPAGAVSHASAAFDLTIGVVLPLPSAPVITDIFANDGPLTGNVAAGGLSTDGHPAINGTGHAGDTINIFDNSTLLGTTVVNSEGNWSFMPAAALANGAHNLHATETNATGTSLASAAYPFSVTYIMITGVYDAQNQLVPSGGTTEGAVTVKGWISDPSIGTNFTNIEVMGGDISNWSRMYQLPLTIVGNAFSVQLSKDTFTGLAGAAGHLGSGTYSLGVQASGSMGNVITMADPRLTYTITDDFNATLPTIAATHVDTSAVVDNAALLATHAGVAPVAPQAEQHVVVGEHGTFNGATGNVTVDLSVDPAAYFKQASAHIQGGESGVHALHLTGDHQVLDLTSLTGTTAAAKVSGIEAVDLGGAHNMLKLSLVDVLNLAETDLFQKDGKAQMLVNGSNGDSVDLSNAHIAGVADGHWMQGGTAQVGGVTYNVYEHSGAHAELLVQQGVQIALHG